MVRWKLDPKPGATRPLLLVELVSLGTHKTILARRGKLQWIGSWEYLWRQSSAATCRICPPEHAPRSGYSLMLPYRCVECADSNGWKWRQTWVSDVFCRQIWQFMNTFRHWQHSDGTGKSPRDAIGSFQCVLGANKCVKAVLNKSQKSCLHWSLTVSKRSQNGQNCLLFLHILYKFSSGGRKTK